MPRKNFALIITHNDYDGKRSLGPLLQLYPDAAIEMFEENFHLPHEFNRIFQDFDPIILADIHLGFKDLKMISALQREKTILIFDGREFYLTEKAYEDFWGSVTFSNGKENITVENMFLGRNQDAYKVIKAFVRACLKTEPKPIVVNLKKRHIPAFTNKHVGKHRNDGRELP